VKRLRRKFRQFRANAVQVDDVGQDGLRAADGRRPAVGASESGQFLPPALQKKMVDRESLFAV